MKNSTVPKCCGTDAAWINNGVNLEYWYCKQCKNEVIDNEFITNVNNLTQQEIDQLFDDWQKLNSGRDTSIDTGLAYDPDDWFKKLTKGIPLIHECDQCKMDYCIYGMRLKSNFHSSKCTMHMENMTNG